MNAAQLQSARKMKRTQTILFFIVLLALIIWSSIGAEFSFGALLAGVGESFRFIFLIFFHLIYLHFPNSLNLPCRPFI